jgi:hypothetical protein
VHTLLDVPVAMCAFYPDLLTPRIPSIAVAAGSFVFVYRNLRPYMKFTLPQVRATGSRAGLTAGGKLRLRVVLRAKDGVVLRMHWRPFRPPLERWRLRLRLLVLPS